MKKGMKLSLIKHMKQYERYVDPKDFVLLEYKPYDMQDYIWFYNLNYSNYSLNRSIDFSHFPYVWDFIDYVINYRIQNFKKELSSCDLERLKCDFLSFYYEKQNNKSEKTYCL